MQARRYTKKIKELIKEENLLLPDFQRDFVWKPETQKKLICSLFLEIPVGSILVLSGLEDIGLRKLCFKSTLEDSSKNDNLKILMDGQQRISTIKSVFSDLYNDTKGTSNKDELHSSLKNRWFLDLSLNPHDKNLESKLKLLRDIYWKHQLNADNSDIEDIELLIICKKISDKNSTERWHPSQEKDKLENYCKEEKFLPLFLILSEEQQIIRPIIRKIVESYIEFITNPENEKFVKDHKEAAKTKAILLTKNITPENKEQARDIIESNIEEFFNDTIRHKEIFGLEYEKSELNKAITAFSTMNKSGVALGVFDIVSAKYSKLKDGRLSEKLFEYVNEMTSHMDDNELKSLIIEKFVDDKHVLKKNFTDMYLNILSLFVHQSDFEQIGKFKLDWIKQNSLLKIRAEDIKKHSQDSIEALVLAFSFLIKKCGVSSITDIKYKLTILPLAYSLFNAKNSEDIDKIQGKIEYSYWVSLFSGKYEKGQNAFSIEHLNKLIKFIKDSNENQFKHYEDDICNKQGYSDMEGFKAFYEDNSYSYSTNIGEYFLQFILSNCVKNKEKIFKERKDSEQKIQIKHFSRLHEDHIIPSSWPSNSKKNKKHPAHSVLNKFYSPSKRNLQRLDHAIDDEVEPKGMNTLCIPTGHKYKREEFQSEEQVKKFLENRFEQFEKRIKNHLQELENGWKE